MTLLRDLGDSCPIYAKKGTPSNSEYWKIREATVRFNDAGGAGTDDCLVAFVAPCKILITGARVTSVDGDIAAHAVNYKRWYLYSKPNNAIDPAVTMGYVDTILGLTELLPTAFELDEEDDGTPILPDAHIVERSYLVYVDMDSPGAGVVVNEVNVTVFYKVVTE